MVFKSKEDSKTEFHGNGFFGDRRLEFPRRTNLGTLLLHKKMNAVRSLLGDIKTKQLHWYGHVQRMEEWRLLKEVMKWSPP